MVCSFEKGQMFAQVYGYIMKYGGTYCEIWSVFENGGKCSGSDFSFVDAKMQPRSTFYHMQMISENFSGFYLDGKTNLDGIRAFGAIDPEKEKIVVMLLNIDLIAARNCTVRLNSSSVEASECEVSIPAGLAIEVKQVIDSQTSIVLVLNLQGQLTKTVTYTKGVDAPQILTLP